ncbi:hypothetical protein GCM10023232_08650 [Sphingosinicella ginsenosidimutans]
MDRNVPARDPYEDARQIIEPLARAFAFGGIQVGTEAIEDAVCGARLRAFGHLGMMPHARAAS